ncbi:hypothetical protein THRCLA_05988 [Thraustotheca clavata]|uniref:CST complex subunit STN1 n=1 Tax=Thraustotheca clavata TaxID=74557 RepID=A0A1V9ZQR1_9STRA|nr:hypothetical protein THRCLA_05988 [Thraustotheca clavata]
MDPINWARTQCLLYENNSYVKVLACQLLALPAPEMFYRFCGRIITRVQMVGIVASQQIKADRTEYLLDDGTGEIPFVWWHTENIPCQLGDLVHIYGRLKRSWQDQIEITLVKAVRLNDPNTEMIHWMQCQLLLKEEYSNEARILPTNCPQTHDKSPVHEYCRRVFLGQKLNSIVGIHPTDELLIKIIDHFTQHDVGVGCQFQQVVNDLSHLVQDPSSRIRQFRKVFTTLRNIGLLYLKETYESIVNTNEDDDIYCIHLYSDTIWPLIQKHLLLHQSISVDQVPTFIVSHLTCRHLPLHWIHQGIEQSVTSKTLIHTHDQLSLPIN